MKMVFKMVWKIFSEDLQKALKKKGFSTPTKIQEMGIPEIVKGQNTLILAPTGLGKTEVSILPIFDKIIHSDYKPISTLYITPLKSLNRDLLKRILWWANELGFEVSVRHGDTSKYERYMQSQNPADMFITTPETLQSMLVGKNLRKHLSNVKWVVIDEIHELVNNKRGVQLSVGLERLKEVIRQAGGKGPQIIGLSATVGSPKPVAEFISGNGSETKIVDTVNMRKLSLRVENPIPEEKDTKTSEETYSGAKLSATLNRIIDYLERKTSILVFTNTRESAEVLSSRLKVMDKDMGIETHHSSLSKAIRIKAEEMFKRGELKSLVCIGKDSRILLSNGLWEKIKKLDEELLTNLISMRKDLKFEKSNFKKILKRGVRDIIKINSNLGFELKCTPDHKILTINADGNLEWKEAGKFNINDSIAIVRNPPLRGRNELFLNIIPEDTYVVVSERLIKRIKKLILKKYKTYAFAAAQLNLTHTNFKSFLSDRNAIPLNRLECILNGINLNLKYILPDIKNVGSSNYLRHKIPNQISPDFIRFIGFLLADGTITRNDMIRLFNKNVPLLKKYAEILENEFGIKSRFFNGPSIKIFQIHATWLCNTSKNIGVPLGRKSKKVKIPEIVFSLPKKHQYAFLAGYFDGDGNIELKKGKLASVTFNTFSKNMAKDLQLLLLNLGIVASLKDISTTNSGFKISVLGGINLQRFVRNCNIWKTKLGKILNVHGYSNMDCIPNLGTILKKLREKNNFSTYYMTNNYKLNPYRYERNDRNISKRQLKALIKIYSKKIKIPTILKFLIFSDIYWDKVKTIEMDMKECVYDILDVDNQNFISNGFIIKNCTSSLELGIDIGSIDFILQYMSPRQVSKILQRVGRSNHTSSGISDGVIITSGADDVFESAAISEMVHQGFIESTRIYGKSLDVLAHQIVGLALEEYKISMDKAYEIIRHAYPFRSLSKDEFFEICMFLQRIGLIWADSKFSDVPVLRRRKRSWEYYYQNLSTIPDTKNYQIIDIASGKQVGVLDEEFVSIHGNPGTAFIIKGQAWSILEIEGRRIHAEPLKGLMAAIPAWEGELIPVPFEVAQRVAEIRKVVEELLSKGKKNAVEIIMKKYPVSRDAAEGMFEIIKRQKKSGFVPGSNEIVLEHSKTISDNWVIIHAPLGSLINETIGRLISIDLTNRLGETGLQTDPYRIMLRIPMNAEYRIVLESLKSINTETIGSVLKLFMARTELFLWRFIHVAKRFGIIKKDADYGKGYVKKVLESYTNTPAYKEAMNEIFTEKIDVKGSLEIIKKMKEGKIGIKEINGLSPIGRLGLEKRFELIGEEKPEKEIFKLVKKRLMETRMRLICTNCGDSIDYPIKDIPETIECMKCRSKLIGVIRPFQSEYEKVLKRFIKTKKLEKIDQKIVNGIMDSASMVASSGKNAVVVLAGRGIGPKTAGRILSKHLDGNDLIQEILKAEKQFARNKRFWRD